LEPVLEVLDNAAPADLHAAAWTVCTGKQWYFGHGSTAGDWSRFWKLDLDADPTFVALWEHLRPRCEALAGGPLRVIRQYANGHTYGLGGQPHTDDERAGCFTLVYYPNPEWKDGWDGETVFHDRAGEIFFAVRPRPNRALFFDSRIPHAGRAPSRICPALRVTVAFKLELTDTSIPPGTSAQVTEISRDGAQRVYNIRVPSNLVEHAVRAHLENLAETVRLPGFRAGKVPWEVIEQRYGAQARLEVLNRLTAEAIDRLLPKGSVSSTVELKGGAAVGDLEAHVMATHLPDLPAIDFSQITLTRLTGPEAVEGQLRNHLKAQVLDRLASAYRFPLLQVQVERELSVIRKAAQSQVEMPAEPQAQADIIKGFRTIAERRLRLGMVIAEMARRHQLRSKVGPELEDMVIDYFVKQARIEERPATTEELRELSRT
jgi:SM-20-related protein